MSKGRIIKGVTPVAYDMPCLDSARRIRAVDPEAHRQISENIEKEAYEKGFAAGEKAGIEMGEQKAAVMLDGIARITKSIEALRGRLLEELEPQVVDLATAIARKIVLEELTVKPDVIVRIVREAMSKIERTGQVTIKINPALYDLFNKLRPQLTELHQDIAFDIDPSVSIRGPVVIGAFEEVVTDVDEQMKNIGEDMRGIVGSH